MIPQGADYSLKTLIGITARTNDGDAIDYIAIGNRGTDMIRFTTAALVFLALSTGLARAQALVPGCPSPGSIPCVATQVFTPAAEATLAASNVSSNVALPATGAFNLMVTNGGSKTAYYVAGSVSTVATTSSPPIDPGMSVLLPQGAFTYLAAITGGSDTTTLTLRSGTGQAVIVYGQFSGSVTATISGPVAAGPISAATSNTSSTITTGGTFQTIQAASASRQSFEFVNICNVTSACTTTANYCYLFFAASGTPNKTTNTISVPPGGSYLRSSGSIPSDALQATCDGTGDHYRLAVQ